MFLKQDAQLSQRDRAAGCVSFGQKWKTGTGRQYFFPNFGHFAFLSHLWDLGTTYDVHLGLIGKSAVDFLLVLIELFSLGLTDEALGANIGSKSAILRQRGGGG